MVLVPSHKGGVQAYSYSVPGKWKDTSADPRNQQYGDQFLHVFGKHTWDPLRHNDEDNDNQNSEKESSSMIGTLYDSKTSCGALLAKGIDNIYFYGDSYMRQVYAAVLITLSGNYKNGSISNSDYAMSQGGADCQYRNQFNEKHCGIRQLNEDGKVCDGRIVLHHMQHGPYSIDTCRGRKVRSGVGGKAINIFSTGNHQLGGNRYGVNDAKAHAKLFTEEFCERLLREEAKTVESGIDVTNGCASFWVSTHHRIIGWFPDEKGPVTQAFNEGMRRFFDSKLCGQQFHYIDVYNMTKSLVETFTLDATSEENKRKSMEVSYDYVHFGMEVNLVKAQIIIDGWVKSLPDVNV